MANIVIMIGDALLNVAAFTCGNYLAKYLSARAERLRKKRKGGMTKLLKLIRLLWKNTNVTAQSFLNVSKPSGKSKLKRSRTSRTLIKACPNGKCLTTKHYQTLFGDLFDRV